MSTTPRTTALFLLLGCLLPAGWHESVAQQAESSPPKGVSVLLIATRTAMREMEPQVWSEFWGDQFQDSQIEYEIIWWELASLGKLRSHPAVRGFEDLARQASGAAAETETHWDNALREDLKPILARAALALLVAEQPEHIDLAEAVLKLARTTNSDAELNVATVEARWGGKARRRLERAADQGLYLPLIRLYDLAVIMPKRIIRYSLLQSRTSAQSIETFALPRQGAYKGCAEAYRARDTAYTALTAATYMKAARHAKRRIANGHKQLDKGNNLLVGSCAKEAELKKAINAFERARRLFLKAQEVADRFERAIANVRAI